MVAFLSRKEALLHLDSSRPIHLDLSKSIDSATCFFPRGLSHRGYFPASVVCLALPLLAMLKTLGQH